jgi:hypothetical protein
MIKLILLIFIVNNLYSYTDEDIKYYIDYKKGGIKTLKIDKEKYNYLKENYENLEKDQKIIWTFENKDYEIISIYNNIKELEEIDKEKQKEELKKQNEEKNKVENERKKEERKKYLYIFVFILVIYFIYKKNKNRKINNHFNKNDFEEVKPTEIKRVKEVKQTQENKKENIKDNNLQTEEIKEDFKELEELRKVIYNKIKYNKEIQTEEKKEIYTQINNIKIQILNKENYNEIQKKLNEINLKG